MPSDEELYEGIPKEKAEAWKKEAEERWGETYGSRTAACAPGRRRSWRRCSLRDAMARYAATRR